MKNLEALKNNPRTHPAARAIIGTALDATSSPDFLAYWLRKIWRAAEADRDVERKLLNTLLCEVNDEDRAELLWEALSEDPAAIKFAEEKGG